MCGRTCCGPRRPRGHDPRCWWSTTCSCWATRRATAGRGSENVSAAAKGLKKLSGELEVPVLALVQLNRNRAGRSDKHPTLTDLRESGDLENTADSVIGLYREEMDHPETTDKKLAELIVLKKRQLGDDVGTIRRLVWVGESYNDFAYAL